MRRWPECVAVEPFSAWMVLFSIAWTLAVVATLLPLSSPIPTWDVWSFVDEWDAWRRGDPILALISTPYNGHVLLVPRLTILAIGELTGFDMRWIQAANLLLAAMTLALLLLFLRQADRRLTALAIVPAACVFSLVQYAGLLAPVSIAQQLCQLLTTLALFLLAAPQISARRFAAALAAAAVGSLCFGSGLVVWVVGAIALVSEVRPSAVRLTLWIAASLCFAAMFHAFAGGQLDHAISQPVLVAQCALVLLGHLLQAGPNPSAGGAMALGLAIVFVALLAFGTCATRPALRPALRPWGLLVLQGLGAALLISLARSHDGLGAGLRSQYGTAVYPILIGLAGITAHMALLASDRYPGSVAARVAGSTNLGIASVVVGASALSFWIMPPILRGWHTASGDAVRTLMEGTADDELIRRFFHPTPSLVRHGVGILAEHRLSVFKDIPGRGRPTGSVDTIDGRGMIAADGNLAGAAGYELEGWAAPSGDQAIESLEVCLAGKPFAPARLYAPQKDPEIPGAVRFALAIPPLPTESTSPALLVVVAQDRAGIRMPIFHALLQR